MGLAGGARLVVGVQALTVALVVGWFATGHASAPDHGLRQLDVLTLHEKVAGIGLVDGRRTVVIAPSTCPVQAHDEVARVGRPHGLPSEYGLVVLQDPALVRALALGRSLTSCLPGYALVDSQGFVRYRSYDPGLADHVDEQLVLLENLP